MKRNHWSEKEKGQSLTELALTLAFLLLILVGIIDIGHAVFVYITLRDAAQEGAVYASYQPADCNGIIDRIETYSKQPVDFENGISDGTVSVSVLIDGTACSSAGSPCAGQDVEVIVTYNDLEITTPFLGAIIGTQTVDITASVVDTILTPICP